MGSKDSEDVGNICEFAYITHLKRGDAIMCRAKKGKIAKGEVLGVTDGDVCLATKFYSTGHTHTLLDKEKMYNCDHRTK